MGTDDFEFDPDAWEDDEEWTDDADPDDTDPDDPAGVGRAPICPSCGVTALPAHLSNVIDTDFVCDNDGCDAFGEVI